MRESPFPPFTGESKRGLLTLSFWTPRALWACARASRISWEIRVEAYRGNTAFALILGIILMFVVCAFPVAADTLQAPDTNLTTEEQPLWSDSALVPPDSLPADAGPGERWLIPLGVILVSGALAVALFAVRSR